MRTFFIKGDRFLLNAVETECFFNFDGRLPRSGGGLYRRKRRKLAYDRLLLFKHPEIQFPSIKILFDYYFSFSIAVRFMCHGFSSSWQNVSELPFAHLT